MNWESNKAWLPFSGNSMNWLLLSGDRILIEQEHEDINAGDILLFRHNKELTCHRVLWLGEQRLVTKGDRSSLCEQIKRDRIVGKVIAIRKGDTVYHLKQQNSLTHLMLYFSKVGLDVRPWKRKVALAGLYTLQLLYLVSSKKEVFQPAPKIMKRFS